MDGPPADDGLRQRAFERYVLPEVDVLYRVARTMTGQPADAEDLVQDTLIRAYRAADRFDGAHPRAWLLTILRNTHVNRGRRRRPQLLDDPDVALARLEADQPDQASPEAIVVDGSFEAAVVEALASLTPRFRRVVELVDLDGLSYAEAAQLVGVPVGTVMSRLHRARARMRSQLVAAGLTPHRGLP